MVEEIKENNENKKQEPKQFLNVHKVYVKAMSFEAIAQSLDQQIEQKKLNLEMQLNVTSSVRNNDIHEAVLTLTLTGKHETNLLWRLQLQEAGLFTIKGFEKEQLASLLNVFCMSVIYPYACNMIYQTVTQGGFQAIYLGPINFEGIYQEKLKSEKEGGGSSKDRSINTSTDKILN